MVQVLLSHLGPRIQIVIAHRGEVRFIDGASYLQERVHRIVDCDLAIQPDPHPESKDALPKTWFEAFQGGGLHVGSESELCRFFACEGLRLTPDAVQLSALYGLCVGVGCPTSNGTLMKLWRRSCQVSERRGLGFSQGAGLFFLLLAQHKTNHQGTPHHCVLWREPAKQGGVSGLAVVIGQLKTLHWGIGALAGFRSDRLSTKPLKLIAIGGSSSGEGL